MWGGEAARASQRVIADVGSVRPGNASPRKRGRGYGDSVWRYARTWPKQQRVTERRGIGIETMQRDEGWGTEGTEQQSRESNTTYNVFVHVARCVLRAAKAEETCPAQVGRSLVSSQRWNFSLVLSKQCRKKRHIPAISPSNFLHMFRIKTETFRN